MPLVSVNNLVRYYGNHCAVDHISFELNTGDILGFLGPNGAGKSTTMQMLCGNLAPTEGAISIDGIDLLDKPKTAKAALGYLPEQPPLYLEMSVDEYLTYCAKLHRIHSKAIGNAVDVAKQRCGLSDVGHRLIGNLSKGYQQRVGIAQAIVHSPRVIVLDEPTVGLDPIQIREIRQLIIELGQQHGIILSTHILPEVQSVCNRVQIINQGKLVFESSMQQLVNDDDKHFCVSFGNDVNTAQLQSLECVESVTAVEDGFIVTLNSPADVFTQQAVNANLKLNKLVPQQQTLEQIFIDLAHSEAHQDNTGNETQAA